MSKKSNKGLAVAVVILFILAAGLVYAAWSKQQKDSTSKEESSVTEGSVTYIDNTASKQISHPEVTESSQESQPKKEQSSQETEESETSETASLETKPQEETDPAVETILSSMSLEEKVGQLFYGRFPGPETAKEDAATYHLGGYVLFGVDFEGYSEEEVKEHIDACQEASKVPMLMGVDEEGGTVVRISPYFREYPFLSPREVYQQGEWDGVELDTIEKAQLLTSLHLNMNLAPVCDLSENPEDFMYDRSFGGDAEQTSAYVKTVVETAAKNGLASCLKHFPGYGNTSDTHTGIATDTRSEQTFKEADFLPFEAGIKAGAGTILVCHNIVECFDAEKPASLSEPVHELLREELGFEGVIVTDDLAMGAIKDYCGEVDSAVLAIKAGNDLLISTEYKQQYEAVLAAVQNGELSEERIDESVRRILRLKKQMGLIE